MRITLRREVRELAAGSGRRDSNPRPAALRRAGPRALRRLRTPCTLGQDPRVPGRDWSGRWRANPPASVRRTMRVAYGPLLRRQRAVIASGETPPEEALISRRRPARS